MTDLNQNLQPENAPVTVPGAIDPYTWGYTNEDGVVTAKKILNFSFNSGSGGTLTLGGTANGNGQMILKDESGSTIFTGDKLGHHYYNTSGTEQVRVDWLGFHAYGTSGTEQVRVDFTGLHNYNSGGTEQIRVDFTGFHAYGTGGTSQERIKIDSSGLKAYGDTGSAVVFYDSSGSTVWANFGFNQDTGSFYMFGKGTGVTSILSNNKISIVAGGAADIDMSGADVNVTGINFNFNGSSVKLAIVPTSQGYNSLYCVESPEVWFMDFCESRDKIDPLFLEVTEPPYHFIKCEGGEYQVWGKRKGMADKRFESKTKEQFEKNDQFWSIPYR